MKHILPLLILVFAFYLANGQENAENVNPWELTEIWGPKPKKVISTSFAQAPSDAIVLFNGRDLNAWQKPADLQEGISAEKVIEMNQGRDKRQVIERAEWEVKDGAFIVKPGKGAIETKQSFGDVQLHIEWLCPVVQGKTGQQYSNSGIFFMGLYEVQILNSYENETYTNGQAGSIYKQHIPMANASRPPGEWQSYDIVFIAPEFDTNGKISKPAYLTVFHNGIIIQNHVELKGPTVFIGEPEYTAHSSRLPLRLQDHGDKVRFRNVWIREL